jgi:hypothetical protein
MKAVARFSNCLKSVHFFRFSFVFRKASKDSNWRLTKASCSSYEALENLFSAAQRL